MKASIRSVLRQLFNMLFSTRASGLYLLLFALAIGTATFIENDFGTSAAQKVIYRTPLFELLLILLGSSILVNIVRFRMIQQRKWPLLLFHLSILIILIGAGITRYFGFEGVMHIRENGSSDRFYTSEPYLKFQVAYGGQTYDFDEKVLFASLGNNHWEESYLVADRQLNLKVREVVPNPEQRLEADPGGSPVLKVVIPGAGGREEYYLSPGDTRRLGGTLFNFTGTRMAGAINLHYRNDSLLLQSDRPLSRMQMATRQNDTVGASPNFEPLLLRSLYGDGSSRFVFPEFLPAARSAVGSSDPKIRNESTVALLLEVQEGATSQQAYLYGNKGMPGQEQVFQLGDLELRASYGSKPVQIPFSLRLNDFILERYPGTESASSYASEVTLVDPSNGLQEDHRIYMNNILNYGGYRFFQSSYDRDELGTYLSVNHDFWGTWVSYLGYALLALGMVLTLFSKKTRFYDLNQKIRKLHAKSAVILLLISLGGPSGARAQDSNAFARYAVSEAHAERFSNCMVQDFKGRMKPVHTLSREIFRKVARKESLFGLTPDQLLLSMYAEPQNWYGAPVIRLGSHEELKRSLSTGGSYASYKDFFNQDGSYKLRDQVRQAYETEPADRGTLEKELLKLDERVNILNMVFSGSLLRVLPIAGDPNQTWQSTHGHSHSAADHEGEFAAAFLPNYREALQDGLADGSFHAANTLVDQLAAYQERYGAEVMPSPAQVTSEILLNRLNVFTRLAGLYIFLGLAFLALLFLSVFKPDWKLQKAFLVLMILLLAGFVLHTVGLGLRWYVSGRAPWSNGYESMIYIGWTTTLAGLIFARKSIGGIAATSVLAATILFVATLSFLDPEITPLVPVLKSYWLTIHVSMEAGSYGFLMLGALMGLINLILLALLRPSNRERVKRQVTELSYLSELTLIAGLFMISIGTFLGGVWANESWGRYWGWDAKETWALVTILIYAFILHMRLIPKMRGLFAYNLATVFGLASVIMTYYGVNYYLSGLHSYATGDPVPIPTWVYVVVACIALVSTLAFMKYRKYPLRA